MSIEQNKEVARKCIEAINEQNYAALSEIMTPELATPLVPGFQEAYVRFEGHHIEIIEMIAESNKVYARCVNSAKHTGEFLGIPATGKHWSISAIIWFCIENGKVTEFTAMGDVLECVKQIGGTITPPQN